MGFHELLDLSLSNGSEPTDKEPAVAIPGAFPFEMSQRKSIGFWR